jgi:hypothetical protein
MAKSLKEALMEKFADLQQLGIAPTTAPPMDDDRPAVVVEMGPDSYGTGGGRRQRMNRGGAYDDETGRGGDVPIRPRGARRGGRNEGGGGRPGERGRGGPPQSGERFRRPDRGGERAALEGLPAPTPGGGPRPGPRPPFGDRGPGGPGGPRPFGDRPAGPGGPRPPFGDRGPGGPGGPRPPFGDRGPGGPGGPRPPMRPGGPPQMGTTERLQRNAEIKRREEGMREQLQGLLNTVGALEVTPEVYDKWLADLTVETGALPPIERVVEAIQMSNSIEAAKVGNAVRQLFRRSRTRPAGSAPANAGPRPAPAAQAPAAQAPAAQAPAPAPVAPAPVAPAPAPEPTPEPATPS